MMGVKFAEIEKAFGFARKDHVYLPKLRPRRRGWKIDLEPDVEVVGPVGIPGKIRGMIGFCPAAIKSISKVSRSGNKLEVQICWEWDDRCEDNVFDFSVCVEEKGLGCSTCLNFLSQLGVNMVNGQGKSWTPPNMLECMRSRR